MAEREATKILNGTTVTSSTFQVDLLRGKVWISNLIIHAPKQDTWQWEAPVFARIGKVYVEANLVSCLFSLWFLWEELPLDIYTILVSDIQVFIERKHNVYNFLLLDPHVVVPVPPQPTVTANQAVDEEDDLVFVNPIVDDGDSLTSPTLADSDNRTSLSRNCDNTSKDTVSADINALNSNEEEEKAQHVVEHIVHSVRRATVAGGDKNPVASLLDQYRHVLTNQLKNFTTDKDNTKKASTTAMMQEGVNLIKHVTANIAEKTVQAQQVIIPARRTLPGERPVYGRVGRLLIQDMRIFVRENHRFTPSESASSSVEKDEARKKAASTNDNINDPASPINAWNPPIVIQHVAIRANEFCPPLTAKEKMKSKKEYDENVDNYDATIMPALYQTMDAYVDIIWKRVLAEVAKSNTGQLFQTAMGEVVNLFVEAKEPIQDDAAS